MAQLAAFVAISAGLVYVSRMSLRAPRSHGFYRFFAWEFIAGLALLNVPVWFVNPWAWHQLISWVLLIACLVPLVFGLRALRAHGQPAARRETEPQLLAFESTSRLVTTGIYRHIRHPLYSSLLLLAWGAFFKAPSALGIVLAIAATACLIATARADEAECLRFFGPDYHVYMQQTKRFVPFLF